MDIFVHVDKPRTPPSPHVDKHGFSGNPPSPCSVHIVYEWPQTEFVSVLALERASYIFVA